MDELGERMSAAEFGDWLAYFEHEPPVQAMAPHALGLLLAALANGPLRKHDGTLFTAADFIAPLWQPPAAPESPPDAPTVSELRAVAAMLGKR